MGYKNIIVDREGEIGFLTLNRPQVGNRLDLEVYAEICQALEELDMDREVRVIIVKGAGENFSVGADITKVVNLDNMGCRNYFLGLTKTYQTFRGIDTVTIAMVHGYAPAAGMGIASSCDLIVASEDAKFGFSAINVGLFCMAGTAAMLRPVVGTKKAMEIIPVTNFP